MSPPPAFRHLLSGNSLKGPLYRVPLMNIPHDFPCDSLAVLPLRGFQGEAWWYGYTPVHPVENVFVTSHAMVTFLPLWLLHSMDWLIISG